jgi:hypothetical protein
VLWGFIKQEMAQTYYHTTKELKQTVQDAFCSIIFNLSWGNGTFQPLCMLLQSKQDQLDPKAPEIQ